MALLTPRKEPRRSVLADAHRRAGARFVELGEWEIPEVFTSPEAEYAAVHKHAALADLCPNGRFKVSGNEAIAVLNRYSTRDLERIPLNHEHSFYLLNERGGIIDEVGLFRADRFLTLHTSCLMAPAVSEFLNALAQHHDGAFEVADVTGNQSSIELHGPRSPEIIAAAMHEGTLSEDHHVASLVQIGQGRCLVTRRRRGDHDSWRVDTGAMFIQSVFDRLAGVGAAMGLAFAGHQCLEMLRLEASIPGAGTELDEYVTPLEVGGADKVDWSREDLVCRRALLHSTAAEFTRRLVTLHIHAEGLPLPGDLIECEGIPIGHVTSAAMSPRELKAIAMGFVDSLKSAAGTELTIRTTSGLVLAATVREPAGAEAATP